MRRVWLLFGLLAAACPSGAKAAPQFRSEVKDLRIAAMDRLPAHRYGTFDRSDPGNCDALIQAAPKTPGGKAVRARGWAVIGERMAHGYTVVSFVGSAQPGTSRTCLLGDGNVALFRGDALKALIWRVGGGSGSRSVGIITPLEPGDIRIFNGDYLETPLADLHFGADGSVVVRKVAASESVCGGRQRVPNIYWMPINRARKLLREAGWLPIPPAEKSEGTVTYEKQGAPAEMGYCSGTGYGFCRLDYYGKAGTLGITVTGDEGWPVLFYRAHCG